MLVSKKIQIEFADSKIKAIDAVQDIRKAVKSASLNLYSRHEVQIQTPMIYEGDKVIVEIKIPDSKVENFAIGNHLRGVSSYLLKRCNGRYDKYVMGKRLLVYTEVATPDMNTEKFTVVDRLEAIVQFTRLLERYDEEAMDKVNRILLIMKEVATIKKP